MMFLENSVKLYNTIVSISQQHNYIKSNTTLQLLQYEEIILEIRRESSVEESKELFDILHEIEGQLSLLEFKYNISVGDVLFEVIRSFDHLDDNFLREYWFKKFKEEMDWPKWE